MGPNPWTQVAFSTYQGGIRWELLAQSIRESRHTLDSQADQDDILILGDNLDRQTGYNESSEET